MAKILFSLTNRFAHIRKPDYLSGPTIGPDSCPRCLTPPFPSGTCSECGYTIPPPTKHKLFSENNSPGMWFAASCCILALAAIFALLFKFLGV